MKSNMILLGICLSLMLGNVVNADDNAKLKVACVGDSITFGFGIKDRAKDSYPAQLQKMLGNKWEVKNFGHSARTLLKKGDHPYWKSPEFKKALAFNPNMVVIMLGTNDTKPQNWKHKAEFIADYIALIDEFKNLPSKPKVWICYPVPVYQTKCGINEKTVKGEVMPAINDIAKKTGANIINLHKQLSNKEKLFPDKIHPNPQGAKVMAKVIAKELSVHEFDKKEFKASDGKTLLYRMYTPKNMDKNKKYPLVMFFHGAGERGNDNTKQLVHGVKNLLTYAQNNKEPVIIIAPQCPSGKQWVNTPWGALSHTMPEKPSEPMKQAIELLQNIITELPVDKQRVYVTGLSMGGFGTWDIIQRMPDAFAAAIPVCGGGDTKEAAKLKNLPIWVFHGDKDTVVKTKRSRDMVAAIKAAGGNPKYTEYKGVGHGCWGKAYTDQDALKWFFSQKKTK